MLTSKEKTEKIRNATKQTGRFLKLPKEEYEKHLKRALEHEKDAGMTSVDEYVYQKHQETSGK